ncbi:MAG: class I SAM-dependent methyltransferase [Gaiellales bacterium]
MEPASSGFADKPAGYYGNPRTDLLERLGRPLGRVLDIGCGRGATAGYLREHGATRLTGIEIHEESAQRSDEVFDEVLHGAVETELGRADGPFDTVLAYDVLEHLVDPYAVMRDVRAKTAPGGQFHISTPNARHWSLVRDVALRGTFAYDEYGHRDITHLRWFTSKDLAAALRDAGWIVDLVDHQDVHPLTRFANRATRGLLMEFMVYQWSVIARNPG